MGIDSMSSQSESVESTPESISAHPYCLVTMRTLHESASSCPLWRQVSTVLWSHPSCRRTAVSRTTYNIVTQCAILHT